MPEHPSHNDPSTIDGFCSSKTTREQFRGLSASSPLGHHPIESRTSPSLDGDGRARIAVADSLLDPSFGPKSDRVFEPTRPPTGLHPGHPSSLRGLFDSSGSAVASSEQPSLLPPSSFEAEF